MIEQPRTAPPQRHNQCMLRLSRSSLRLGIDRLDTPGSGDAFRVEERAPAQSAADSMPNTETVLHNSAALLLWRSARITYLKTGLDGHSSFVHDDIALYALVAAYTPNL